VKLFAGKETAAAAAIVEADELLQLFLASTSEADRERLLTKLVVETAAPIAKNIARRKLQVSFDKLQREQLEQDIADLCGDVSPRLIARLNKSKSDSSIRPIKDFRSYVAVTTYHACHEYLRQKYPQRHRLKNRLRYLLTHDANFALWDDHGGADLIGGFARWQGKKTNDQTSSDELRRIAEDTTAFLNASSGTDARRLALQELLGVLFRLTSTPVELDALVGAVAQLLGIKDQTIALDEDESGIDGLPESAPKQEPGVTEALESRGYLACLWTEIRALPDRQRAALLLNLRSAQGQREIDCGASCGEEFRRQTRAAVLCPVRPTKLPATAGAFAAIILAALTIAAWLLWLSPATKSAQLIPMTPSPAPTRPRAVSHADSTIISALRSRFIISHASKSPSSFVLPSGCASTTCEYIGLALSRMPCVAR